MILENKSDIFDLIDKFESSGLQKLELSVPRHIKIKMTKPAYGLPQAAAVPTAAVIEQAAEKTITAPLVGTFYSAPSPDSEPYVTVGAKVSKGMTVCIIEAMKTMNEIESGTDGEITEIMVSSGGPVEYGQLLFKLK